MALGGSQKGGGAAVKGLRLLTMTRGPDGFGFHMYTNKERDGQYIKNVAINSPSDLAGMLPGDHVLYVDNHNVNGESHHQVVERVRLGTGEKKILVIDMDTEDEMAVRKESINPEDAIVMIPRSPPPEPPPPTKDVGTPEPLLNFDLSNMESARKRGGKRSKEMVKNRSWKESVDAYNKL